MIESTFRHLTKPQTLLELLEKQAGDNPHGCAYTFLGEGGSETSLTFAELDEQARRIAAAIQRVVPARERVLLVYPAGLDFIVAFFGCAYAGVLAVPATYPKPRRPMPRLSAITRNCQPALALTTAQALRTLDLARVAPELLALHWIATDTLPQESASQWCRPQVGSNDLAFLQYTSGSTSEPKGVMVTQGNLLHNLEMICQGFDIQGVCPDATLGTGVSWLPAYHDMGLIGGMLESLYVGGRSIIMPPASFLQRPLRWLKAISDSRAEISGGPNFGYDLCVQRITPRQRASLDLRSWKIAFCGAEPIRAETLRRFAEAFGPCGFRAEAFYPCYGLAEATLLVAGGRGPGRPVVSAVRRRELTKDRAVEANGEDANQVQELVGCGQALLDQEVVIVDPKGLTRQPPGQVGEIWIKGPNVAQGYWNRPEDTAETFHARLADAGEEAYLRTGDLGFVRDGSLYITGRVKDVIIIRGRNHYPQDIELTVDNAHPVLQSGIGVAFSVEVGGSERLVVIHEINRQYRDADLQEVMRCIRRGVAEEHELDVHAVVLTRQANLPRTTSGKPQRNLCRSHYLAGELKVLADWTKDSNCLQRESKGKPAVASADRPPDQGHEAGDAAVLSFSPDAEVQFRETSQVNNRPAGITPQDRPLDKEEIDRLAERIIAWFLDWLVERTGIPTEEVDRERPFAEYGLDSLTAVEMSQALEDWLGVELTPVVAWNYPTPVALAGYLARRVGSSGLDAGEVPEPPEGDTVDRFEELLAEIEGISESEAKTALDRGPRAG
jgi:acyl-CoA synthetase (AMP-forming)/AMP-acid ligase II/acyl carrier protein